MGKAFRPYELDQTLLMPPCLRDWLPQGHLAHFIDSVAGELDLSAIYASYEDPRGQAAYEPAMMVRLLLYGYCTGKLSSRKIERATYDDVAFRYLAADTHPDHDTIAAFRQRHLSALERLFVQVLRLCQKAGLVKLGHVAIDGTKIKANANSMKRTTYGKLQAAERAISRQVTQLFDQAAREDVAESKSNDRTSLTLPPELADPLQRLRKIREAKAALEAEARDDDGHPPDAGGPQVPADERRVNLTDPDSRMMRDAATGGFVQAYNAQLAVDDTAQVIVATSVTQENNDYHQLEPMLDRIQDNMRTPATVTADTGYFSLAAIAAAQARGVDAYIPPHAQPKRIGKRLGRPSAPVVQMRNKLATCAGKVLYALRKTTVEPVIGLIKEQRRFRQFSFRGLHKVRAEWQLVCTTHNLLKLYRATWMPQAT